jgi:signal transduction histidine kinase
LDDLVGVYNQMADRLRDERTRQQEQNAFLERVLAASPAGIVVMDFDERIVSANPAARRLLASSEARDALVGRALAELDGGLAPALAELGDGESRVLALSGGRRVKCQRAQFLDRGFARPFFVLEELTDELRRSEKAAYDKLIRMMSHEVNNTAAAVGSLLSACLNYREQIVGEDRGDYTSALEVAIARTRSLSAFMNDFADVVRLPPPRREPTDIAELVSRVVALMRAEAERHRIQLQVDLTPELPRVEIDPVQMEQVLLNILKNGMQAAGDGGTVTLRLAREGSHVVLTVRDTGPGILPGAREHLFTPFFTTKENGQGIGLTLVREILTAHGFEFTLENHHAGGAEFLVRM